MKTTIGRYRGVDWKRLRLCDVFPYMDRPLRSLFYFPFVDGQPTGDHFATQRELFEYIEQSTDVFRPS